MTGDGRDIRSVAPSAQAPSAQAPSTQMPSTQQPPTQRALVDLTAQTRATQLIADRSRSAGIWSLGHLNLCWAALLAGGLVLGVIAAISSGLGAVLGVVLGTAIVGIFFTVSAVVIAHVGSTNPKTVMLAALFTYVIKVVALGIVLVAMPTDGLVNTRWMAGAIGLGLFCWLGAHMRYVWTLKIFYVDPG